jgi:hypothetical protein
MMEQEEIAMEWNELVILLTVIFVILPFNGFFVWLFWMILSGRGSFKNY